MSDSTKRRINCTCGAVELEATGPEIVTTVCTCASCRQAGEALERFPGAAPVLDQHGGTPFVLFRKDRFRCVHGADRLDAYKLKSDSPTRRVVARCCNTAMFLDFTKGHWVSIYEGRFADALRQADRRLGMFVPRLIWAWTAMGLRTPTLDFVTAEDRELISTND